MRLLITVGGGMLAMMFCDALSKTIDQTYLQQPYKSLAMTWAGTVVLTSVLFAGFVFLFRKFGKGSFRWRDTYYPSLGETILMAINVPILVLSLMTACSHLSKYRQEPSVPAGTVNVFYGVLFLLSLAIVALVINLGRDLLVVRRLGWRQIEQMEAARVKEDGALTLPG